MLAIVGASGKIGGATLDALLSYKLVDAKSIVSCTTSQPGSQTWSDLESKGVIVRHATFEDGNTIEKAFAGCKKLFLVSTPKIEMDFNDAQAGTGREKSHFTAIEAARRAKVEHVYYTSLAFPDTSKAGVMRAHILTEAYLASLVDIKITVLREGLYNESWPLYLGYYDPKGDARDTIVLGGDGKISWTAISDLGLASAIILSDNSDQYTGQTLYLSNPPEYAKTLQEVAEIVGKVRGRPLSIATVSRDEHERFYIDDRGMDAAAIKWWSTTYDALRNEECLIRGSPLANIVKSVKGTGRNPIPLAETVQEMLS